MPWVRRCPARRLRVLSHEHAEPGPARCLSGRPGCKRRATRAQPVAITAHEPGLYAPFEVSDVEFSGGAGERVRAWYIACVDPAGRRRGFYASATAAARAPRAEHILHRTLGYAWSW